MSDVRVLIVADDPLARAGLAALLAAQPGCVVVGQVGEEAHLPAARQVYRPDVVLWDVGWDRAPSTSTPAVAGLEHLEELAEAGLPAVVLLADEAQAAEARLAGARGLFLRDTGAERLAAALAAVAQGLVVLDPSLAASLLASRDPSSSTLVEDLTPREQEVLRLLAEGLPNKAIALRLGISEHTVKFHVNAVLGKLGAQSRTEAVVRATRLGLILL
jgi:DNA-binding NarL/FixJ family response regulator